MSRIAIFSHDSYGLGHLRRSLLLAEALVAADEKLDCLVVTGSPRALAFKLPERVDAVKIPSITKSANGRYASRKLLQSRAEILALRTAVTAAALSAYEPDVVLVDHSPTGADGELLPVLQRLSRLPRRPRLLLGLRDIVDHAATVNQQWTQGGVWDALDYYDEVLVYGDGRVLTTADELGLASRLAIPVTTTGYVAPRMPEAQNGDPFLLVTAGGGGDGQHLLRRVLGFIEAGHISIPVRIVSGPLLSKARQAELITRTNQLDQVTLIDFTTELRQWISSATAMISMAGYNTTVEALASGTPTLMVPRSDFRHEQRLRAQRVSSVVDHIHAVDGPDSLTSADIDLVLSLGRGAGSPINLAGSSGAARRLLEATAPATTVGGAQ